MDPHKRQQPEVPGCFYLWFAFVALIGVLTIIGCGVFTYAAVDWLGRH